MYSERLKSEEDIILEDTINKYSKYLQTVVLNLGGSNLQAEDIEEIIPKK